MPSINEDRELHPARPAPIHERIERCACGATGAEHVVDEDDGTAGNSEPDLR